MQMELTVDSTLDLVPETEESFDDASVRDLAEPKVPEAPLLTLATDAAMDGVVRHSVIREFDAPSYHPGTAQQLSQPLGFTYARAGLPSTRNRHQCIHVQSDGVKGGDAVPGITHLEFCPSVAPTVFYVLPSCSRW